MKRLKDKIQSKKYLIGGIAAVMLCIGIVYGLRGGDPSAKQLPVYEDVSMETMEHADHGHAVLDKVKDTENLVYVCPMNCVEPMEKSGQCPVCGMELVAVSAESYSHTEGPPTIRFSPETVRVSGIQVAPVERKFVTKEIRLFGKIEYDPVEQYKVTAFAPGIIDRIYVKRAGQTVRAGDPLFDMHSSELFFLEQDLFEVLKHFPDAVDYRPARGQIYKRQMRPPRRQIELPKPGEASPEEIKVKKDALEKLNQIRRKMMLLGLTKEDIERVIARGLPSGISTVTTPTTGIVQEQFAFKGSYVNTGETIFTIANQRYVWARLDGYAADFPWVRLGQDAEFKVDGFPGETFKGKVIYLDPQFDPETRTFKIGVLHTDTENRLRPNMLVRCVIHSKMTSGGVSLSSREGEQEPPLVIPDTAPLITGNRAVVYLEIPDEPGTYEGREIVLGPRAKGYYLVKSGLRGGEKVVVNGNFKLDSAVQILAKPSMMESRGGMMMSEHAHVAETEPVQMKPENETSDDGGQTVDVEDIRRARLSEFYKSRPMKSSRRVHEGSEHPHGTEIQPTEKKAENETPGAGKPMLNLGDNRRERFSEYLKSRPMKSSGRMRTSVEHSPTLHQRDEIEEGMRLEKKNQREEGHNMNHEPMEHHAE